MIQIYHPFRILQENYRTLLNNLEITKKVVMEEMNRSKELAMNKDKLVYDIEHATKLCTYFYILLQKCVIFH